MTSLAGVILAHGDPDHLHDLIDALDDVPISLHCDLKTPASVSGRIFHGLPDRVSCSPRVRTGLGSWSLVEAELLALRDILKRSSAEHIVVMSGADYPLMSMDELLKSLQAWQGASFIWNRTLPYTGWNSDRHGDGGLWRVQQRFLTWRGHAVKVGENPIPVQWRRTPPPDVELRSGAQWKVYSRSHALALLDVVERRPDLVRYWRTTFIPEETFVSSVLASRSLFGKDALPVCYDDAWFTIWDALSAAHPRWLTLDHLAELQKADGAVPSSPAHCYAPSPAPRPRVRPFFARKFHSAKSATLLAELRQAR